MKIERYCYLLNDRHVRKGFKQPFVKFFVNVKNEIVVEFMFGYLGINNEDVFGSLSKRINLRTFPLSNFKESAFIYLDQQITILANAENNLYALSYQLTINTNNREVNAILLDAPFYGEKLITREEKSGIFIHY